MKKKKKIKNSEAQFMYRCRLCGKVFADIFSGIQSSESHLINAIYKIRVNNQSPPPMVTAHYCNKTSGGVADLLGFKIK